jgi:hypothetical protein
MTIPDGGFIEHHDESPSEAKKARCEATVELQFQSDQTNWAAGVTKDY